MPVDGAISAGAPAAPVDGAAVLIEEKKGMFINFESLILFVLK